MQTTAVRTPDLTPVPDLRLAGQDAYTDLIDGFLVPSSGGQGGGAADFLDFLTDERIPFVVGFMAQAGGGG